MRTILSLVILAAACGGSNNNGDGGNDDLSMNGNDMAMSNDLASATFMCDPLVQNCPDPTMPRCTLTVTGSGATRMVNHVCSADGTAARDQSCNIDSTSLIDNCVKGTWCAPNGLPAGMNACRKLCASDTDCGSGQMCARSRLSNAFGLCVPTCTEFGTDCPTGTTCGNASTDITMSGGTAVHFLSCRASGPGKPGDACGGANPPCGDNMLCLGPAGGNRQCSPLCDNTHACPIVAGQPDGGMWMCSNAFGNVNACQ